MRPISEKISFLRHVFRGADLSRDGVNIAVRCPNPKCSSRIAGKRKFSIRVDTDQAHCWVCELKTHCNLIPALRKVCTSEQIKIYVEKYLPPQGKRRLNSKSTLKLDDNADEIILDFPSDFQLLGTLTGTRDPDIKEILHYLKKRGLKDRDLWYFKLGISKERRFLKRVIMPSFDAEGYINYYTARSIGNGYPKYLIPSIGRIEVICNEVNIDWAQELTIVEGPFDLMKCDENATCLQGSGLTEDYALFWKIVQNKTPVILGLDADAQIKSHKYAKLLSSYDIPVKMLPLGEFSDVGEMDRSDFIAAKEIAVPWHRMSAIRAKISAMSPISGSVL